jgi:hypothetical protein
MWQLESNLRYCPGIPLEKLSSYNPENHKMDYRNAGSRSENCPIILTILRKFWILREHFIYDWNENLPLQSIQKLIMSGFNK